MKRLTIIILLSIVVSGCASLAPTERIVRKGAVPGIYYEVKKGESLWGIAKEQNIELATIIKANHLPDASKIEVGQLIFIPKGKKITQERVSTKKTKGSKFEGFIWPTSGQVISYFGSMSNLAKNKGIDIQTKEGSSIVASRSGRVTFVSEYLKGYGKTIIIDHPGGFQTVYAQNSQNLTNFDKFVTQGMVIAKVGKTGRADSPSLHFEIRKNHKPKNPFYYLP